MTVQPSAGGVAVAIAVTGNAAYEWHRLRDPDNRFWVDIKNARLQGPPIEEPGPSPLVSVRVRQDDPATVRIALSLNGPKSIGVTPSATGLLLQIGDEDVAGAAALWERQHRYGALRKRAECRTGHARSTR